MDEKVEPVTDPVVCIACESPNIRRRPRAIYFTVVALLVITWGWAMKQAEAAFFLLVAAAIFTMVTDRWVCSDCGESWK